MIESIRGRTRALVLAIPLLAAACAPAAGQVAESAASTAPVECFDDHVVAGALPVQPGPVYCMLTDKPSSTAEAATNTWVDDFNHDVGMATMAGSSYEVYGPFGDVLEGMTWRGGSQKDHWMVDLTPDPAGTTGGTVLRPDQSFRFTDDGTLTIEADYAAAHPDYGQDAWGEVIVTTASASTGYRPGALYGYELFPNHWTLGCRLQPSRVPICSLMRNVPGGGTLETERAWEISFFQHEGDTVFGGFPSEDAAWRACEVGEGDANCRDRFRLTLTETSLQLDVNGVHYFSQTGLPKLPDELLNEDLYVYFGSMFSRHTGQTIRYHWDRLAVNPELSSSPTSTPPPTTTPPLVVTPPDVTPPSGGPVTDPTVAPPTTNGPGVPHDCPDRPTDEEHATT